jgi:nitrilase
MKAAAIQMTSGRSVERNLRDAEDHLADARRQGAELVVLPENFAFLGADDAERLSVSEEWRSGPVQDFLSAQATRHEIWLVGGTVPIRHGDKAHSASLLIPGADEAYLESATTIAGEEPVVAATPFGRIGLSICYDLRFPRLFERLSSMGMEILVLPAAFTVPTGEAHWRVLLRARAIETQSFVVAAAQVGEHESGRQTYGHSLIVDPWGDVLAEKNTGPGVIVTNLDMMRLNQIRETFPVLDHRRDF